MSNPFDDADYSAALHIPQRLLPLFHQAAQSDALIKGKNPMSFLFDEIKDDNGMVSITELTGNLWKGEPERLGSNLAYTLTGLLSSIGTVFACVNLFDSVRSMAITVINELPIHLHFGPKALHQETGHLVCRPGVYNKQGKVAHSNRIPAADTDGAGLGFFLFEKHSRAGVGFYGTEGAIHLHAHDTHQLPDGVFIGWRSPENGKNDCAVSVNHYKGPRTFYEAWINDGSARQIDGSSNKAAGVTVHCAIDSLSERQVHMVVVLSKP